MSGFGANKNFRYPTRYSAPASQRKPDAGAVESVTFQLCVIIGHLSPMALYRLVCAFGQQRLVTVLMRCGLPLPTYVLAAAKHRHYLRDPVYVPTLISGRVIWQLGDAAIASPLRQALCSQFHTLL